MRHRSQNTVRGLNDTAHSIPFPTQNENAKNNKINESNSVDNCAFSQNFISCFMSEIIHVENVVVTTAITYV